MANEIIRPSELPSRVSPVASEIVPSDNGSVVGGVTWAAGVNAGRPLANQVEAETGSNASKAMTPLTTKQAIDAQVPGKISQAISDLNLGTASQQPVEAFATAAQGVKADTAVQPGDLADVATSGDYDDLTNKPTLGSAAAADVEDFATAAQGERADNAIATRADLKALDTNSIKAAFLKEPGREGQYLWDASVPVLVHQGDPREQRYVAPNPAADGAWVRTGSVEIGTRWTTDSPPVRIFPFGGRVLVGASSENDGASGPGRLHSWFDDSDYVGMHSSWMSLEQNAQLAAVTNSGLGSIVGATRSSDFPGTTGGTIGVTGWGFNDSTEYASGAWGGYFIGVSKPGALAGVIGAEIGSWNQGEDAPYITPYSMFPSKAVYALHLANGIPTSHGADTPSYLASSALSIINNHETDGKFWAGIVIASTALETSPVDAQTSMAIALAKGHAIQWFSPGNGLGPSIFSEVDTPTGDALYKLAFTDNGVQVRNFLNIPLFRVAAVPNAVNRLDIFPGTSGEPVTLAAAGADANIDVALIPQGSGVLNIGGPAVAGGAGAQAGYLTLKYNNTTYRIPVHDEV